jgi:hypothetical protein
VGADDVAAVEDVPVPDDDAPAEEDTPPVVDEDEDDDEPSPERVLLGQPASVTRATHRTTVARTMGNLLRCAYH